MMLSIRGGVKTLEESNCVGLQRRLLCYILAALNLSKPADVTIFQIFPSGRTSRSIGPGVEIRDDSGDTRRR